MLNHIVTESDQAGRRDLMVARLGLRGQMIRVSLAAAAGTFVIAGILFFLIPRVEQATLPLRAQFSRMVTGFSDRVDLGSFGDIETDKTVVMRVQFPDDGIDPAALPNLRWRGIVFDTFDGRTWSVGRPDRRPVARGPGGQFLLGSPRGRGPVVRQEVYLDPIGTDIIFAAPRPLRLDLRAGTINVDDMGTISVPTEAARLHYVVESELETAPPPGTRVSAAGAALSDQERRRFLQLPELSPEIARLARDVTAGSRDPLEAAHRLSLFLSTNYGYSLSKRETSVDLLQDFLFVRRAGNCEYFSAALAVMLRSLDIPARVVGGFQRGEWNPYGRYFMVRLADAHAWVEAYFDGLGWMTFDPSPRAQPEPRTGPWALSLQLDAARMRWYRYVVNWSLQDQRVMVSTVQRQAQDFRLAFAWPRRLGRPVLAHRRGRPARRGRARVAGLARSLPGRGGPIRAHAALLRARPAPARAARARPRRRRDGPPVLRPRGRRRTGLRRSAGPNHRRLRARPLRGGIAERRGDLRRRALPRRPRARRPAIRAHLRTYGALVRALNVERLRLAPGLGRRLASGPFSPL